MKIYNEMKSDYEVLKSLRENAKNSLKDAPSGYLKICRARGSVQYYHAESGRNGRGDAKYIRKDDASLVAALAQKAYDHAFLNEVESQIRKMEKNAYLINYSALGDIFGRLDADRKELVTPYVLPDDLFIEEWMSEKYNRLGFSVNTPEIWTESGVRVRSKSEKIIGDKFTFEKVPFRCEFPLNIPGFGIVYPDFQILKMSNRREVYLDHFGMMDDPEYARKAVKKMETLALGGFFPGENIFYTFETYDHPLNMRSFNLMIEKYFR